MTVHVVRVRSDTYVDSVLLMSASRTMRDLEDVEWATAVMGTETYLEELRGQGFSTDDLSSAGANHLVLAVRAGSEDAAEEALAAGERSLAESGEGDPDVPTEQAPRSLLQALEGLADANVALISVPGDYAALEAHKALSAGLHVLLFSDNVPIDDEVALKERARRLGRFVMGPGAGTAMLGGIGLGFANAVGRGPVGVVAAAGTGAQESMSLLARWGSGVRDLVGVGGRDLSEEVRGRMMRMGIEAFAADDDTEALLIVSKPPAPGVARDLLDLLSDAGKPSVAALLGLSDDLDPPDGVRLARTLEEGVRSTLEILGRDAPDPAEGLADEVERAIEGLPDERRAIRGLFSGGTLCYEAMVVISDRLGAVHSNVPLQKDWALPGPDGAHVCLDLGEEEYTQGRAHPMIDPELRLERIREEAERDDVAVLLLDVVLGYGAMEDPAGALAPACAEAIEAGVRVVAYVLGTDDDPQRLDDQRRTMAEAGCLVAPTGARSGLMAAAAAARKPEIAGEAP